MSVRLAIVKEGFDVRSETDPKNYIFDASLNHLKTYASGTVSKSLTASSSSTEAVAHNLGYRPLVLAYYKTSDASTKWSVPLSDTGNSVPFRLSMNANVTVIVDEDNIYFFIKNKSGATRTIDIEFEVFYEGD